MTIEKIDKYFNGIAETYDMRVERQMIDEDGYIVRTVAQFPEKKDMHLLDLGCGTGLELIPILKRDETLHVTAVDCASQMLDILKVNLKDHMERVQTVCADFFTGDLGSNVYDGVLSVMALHYYGKSEMLELFKRIRIALKEDGFFLLTDKFAPAQGYEEFCRSELERKLAEAHLPHDNYYCFTPRTIANEAALLFKAGFTQVEVRWAKSNTAVLLATK